MTAPAVVWDNLCLTNNSLKTGKSRDAKNSVRELDVTLQEILHFPPVKVQGVKRHFEEFTYVNLSFSLQYFLDEDSCMFKRKHPLRRKKKLTVKPACRVRKLLQNHELKNVKLKLE